MDSTPIKSNVAYYVAKTLGFLPFAGSNKVSAMLYSLLLWTILGLSGIYMIVYNYKKVKKASVEYTMLMKVIFVEVLLKFAVALCSAAVSAGKSRGSARIRDQFRRFDRHALRAECPAGARAQAFYLLYVLSAGVYNMACMYAHERDLPFYVPPVWTVLCASTAVPVIQYLTHVRMLRRRYRLANRAFAASMVRSTTSCVGCMYPSEIDSMFIKLRDLTEEVKTYYANHAVLIVIESVIILVSSATALTINYQNKLETRFIHNGYFVGHCMLRLLFLYYVVRETHNTILETKNTALIGHEALSITSDATTTKYVEIIVISCWNHPVVFDAYDVFDLDYKLLQSIISSVVTYVVVLIQINLAIMEKP